jgi:hypothetical protein
MKTIQYKHSAVTENNRDALVLMLEKVKALYTHGSSGAKIALEQLIKVVKDLDLENDVKQEPTSQLNPNQTREKEVDTAKANSLQFGYDEALDVPLFWFRDPTTGKKMVLFGNHRLYKGKNTLEADSMPGIEITHGVAGMSSELLGVVGKFDNSKRRKENLSSLEEDSRATLQAVRAWMREDPVYGAITDESEIKRILSDKEILKEEHPELWEKINAAADISLVNSKTEIINHMLGNNDNFRPYRLGKSDAVYTLLEEVFGASVVDRGENTICHPSFNDGKKTTICLADGGQQLEQGYVRGMKKLIAEETLVWVNSGIGNSKSSVIGSRIKTLEILCLLLHYEGLEKGIESIRKMYGGGIMLFPNFKEGLDGTKFKVGKKSYNVEIEPEMADSFSDFKVMPIDDILRGLLKTYVRERENFIENKEVKFTSFPHELKGFIFPTLISIKDTPKRTRKRKRKDLDQRA